MTIQTLSLEDGKYELRFDDTSGSLTAYRYGEPWQDFSGNKFIYLLMQKALAEPQPEPVGFVLVPKEPTPEMIGAMAIEEATGTINGISTLGIAGACLAWESALAAAPKPHAHP